MNPFNFSGECTKNKMQDLENIIMLTDHKRTSFKFMPSGSNVNAIPLLLAKEVEHKSLSK